MKKLNPKLEKILEAINFFKGLRTDMVRQDYKEHIDLALKALDWERMKYAGSHDDWARKYYED